MEVIGIVFTALNLVAFYIWRQARHIFTLFNETEGAIEQEFDKRQEELATTLTSESVEKDRLETVINGLRRIHFSSIKDLLKLHKLNRRVSFIVPGAFGGLGIAIISLAVGMNLKAGSSCLGLRNHLVLTLPVVLFLFELVFLWTISHTEKLTNKTKSNYLYRKY